MSSEIYGFYFVTDSSLTKQGILKDSEDAIKGGASVIQYREKNKSFEEMVAEATQIQELCMNFGAILIINDSLELALAVGADGLHLGPHDISVGEARAKFKGLIGVSCSSLEDVKNAQKNGAEYIAVSPVFFTDTKKDIGKPLGLEGIAAFRKATKLPIVAIGGINMKNIKEVVMAGADSVCAILATVGTVDVRASVRKFSEIINIAVKERTYKSGF